ncbi:peptidoglycan DD-metalloendopeptidase family protein [Bacillus timonensis]|uniref:peptidoglycan DD-metalloendopeptidase family protein n=1 Tax=Bacillus timonensis TaxID=1033734 RepID=UPI0002EBBCAD|nr:peptidoglycan DD-metalloendopeptidase family protein [Bacillus timonensis]
MREEEKKRTSQKSSLQRFFRKRWVFPAIYLVSAALILTAVLWFQGKDDVAKDDLKYGENQPGTATGEEPSVPVNQAGEKFKMPVIDEDAIQVFREFYDAEASAEKQEAALVVYNNIYSPNKGIDIVAKNGETFEVVASLAGTVSRAEKDPLHGNVVEIEHSDGVVTMYQSLADLKVAKGDVVEQGEVLGMAGENQFDKEAAVHVHFEIRNNGVAVNPLEYFGQTVTSLEDSEKGTEDKAASKEEDKQVDDEKQAEEGKQPAEDKQPKEEEKPEDNKKPADEEGTPADDEDATDEENANSPDASIGMAKA